MKTRWPFYLLGLLLFAYAPARMERSALVHPAAFVRTIGVLALLIAGFELAGRRRTRLWATLAIAAADESDDDPSSTTVLDLSGVVRGAAALMLLIALVMTTSACGPAINLADGLKVDAAATGWIEVRRDKVVPALTLTLRNVSDERLRVLLLNARFHSTDDADEWGTGFLTAAGSEGLAPGAATGTIVLKGEFGYTGLGVQRMVDQFVETKVELFAKYGAEGWTRLGEFTIARQLLR